MIRHRWQAVVRRVRGVGALYVKYRPALRVIARGLSAPLWNGITSRRPVDDLLYGLATVFARLAGMTRWRLVEGKRRVHDVVSTPRDQGGGR